MIGEASWQKQLLQGLTKASIPGSFDRGPPIDPARFAMALEGLPIDSIHAKAAEIRNSIAHLRSSNEQMMPFADEGDQDCKEAMFENLTVIGRMNQRIALLRAEVERRGNRQSRCSIRNEKQEQVIKFFLAKQILFFVKKPSRPLRAK